MATTVGVVSVEHGSSSEYTSCNGRSPNGVLAVGRSVPLPTKARNHEQYIAVAAMASYRMTVSATCLRIVKTRHPIGQTVGEIIVSLTWPVSSAQ